MLFADAPSSDTVQIVSLLLGFLSTVFTGIMAFFIARLNAGQKDATEKAEERAVSAAVKAEERAVSVEDVRTTLKANNKATAHTLQGIAEVGQASQKTGEATHMLVNSAMTEQKRLLAVTSEALAKEKPTPANIAGAQLARQQYDEHVAKQSRLDDRNEKDDLKCSTN